MGAERNATGYIELAHCFIQGMKKYSHYIQNKIIEVKLVGRHAEESLLKCHIVQILLCPSLLIVCLRKISDEH